MAKDKQPFEALSETAEKAVEQNMEQIRGAADSYFSFLQKTMSSSPWGGADLIEKMKTYTDQNISATVECVRKLSEAKNFPDAARIQTEFMQKQLNSFGEQARSLGEAYAKAATVAMKATPFHMST